MVIPWHTHTPVINTTGFRVFLKAAVNIYDVPDVIFDLVVAFLH